MSQVIDILTSLGVDSTVFYQFAIFFVAFFLMNVIVFKPYLRAYQERMNRTVGGQQEAASLLEQASQQELLYKDEAKKLNSQIKEIFGNSNSKAKKEAEEILTEAKKESEQQMEKARQELDASVAAVRKEMEEHIPSISENIQKKFVR